MVGKEKRRRRKGDFRQELFELLIYTIPPSLCSFFSFSSATSSFLPLRLGATKSRLSGKKGGKKEGLKIGWILSYPLHTVKTGRIELGSFDSDCEREREAGYT